MLAGSTWQTGIASFPWILLARTANHSRNQTRTNGISQSSQRLRRVLRATSGDEWKSCIKRGNEQQVPLLSKEMIRMYVVGFQEIDIAGHGGGQNTKRRKKLLHTRKKVVCFFSFFCKLTVTSKATTSHDITE